jgi:integrase
MTPSLTRRKANGREREWPKVTRKTNPGGKVVWIVDLGRRLPSEPRRQRFDKEAEARQVADRYREQFSTSRLAAFTLRPKQREDAFAAFKALDGTGASLEQAVRFYRDHNFPSGGDRTVAQVVAEFLKFKGERQRIRSVTLRGYRNYLHHFSAEFGTRLIKEIPATEIDAWMLKENAEGETQTLFNKHTILNTFFNFARGTRERKGKFTAKPYRLDNPMDAVPRIEPEERLPERCLTLEEVNALLASAHETNDEFGMLAYTVLGLFCGVRVEELKKLTWRKVNVLTGYVTIDASVAKAGFHRHIPIAEKTRLWLAASGIPENKDEKVCPRGFNKRWAKVRDRAGLLSIWPDNALRHSFGSYASEYFGEAETKDRMGHRTPDILIRHYKTLVNPGTGERYFNLPPPTPPSGTEAVPFPVSA